MPQASMARHLPSPLDQGTLTGIAYPQPLLEGVLTSTTNPPPLASRHRVLGASGAAQYPRRGFDVVATDPCPDADANCASLDDAWPALTGDRLSPAASRSASACHHLHGRWRCRRPDLVKENGPERPDVKINSSPTWRRPPRIR